jgi:trehalose 6-phosphate phosphatase
MRMPSAGAALSGLPHALRDLPELNAQMRGRRPAVFLDYDGTLTPIVQRPEDALISESMRGVVRELARRCTVCVVSGRDRAVVQQLMGVDDLVVAGSHGFDIWSPQGGGLEREEGTEFAQLLAQITQTLQADLSSVDGALIEPKRSSVAVHYRLVDEGARPQVAAVVDRILSAHPDELKVTPGKMVFEIQPKLDWDKGKAVLYLLDALGLDRDDVVPLYLGDDITDEDAFRALSRTGIGILVADPDDPEVAGRVTAARFVLRDTQEVEDFLGALAR